MVPALQAALRLSRRRLQVRVPPTRLKIPSIRRKKTIVPFTPGTFQVAFAYY